MYYAVTHFLKKHDLLKLVGDEIDFLKQNEILFIIKLKN